MEQKVRFSEPEKVKWESFAGENAEMFGYKMTQQEFDSIAKSHLVVSRIRNTITYKDGSKLWLDETCPCSNQEHGGLLK